VLILKQILDDPWTFIIMGFGSFAIGDDLHPWGTQEFVGFFLQGHNSTQFINIILQTRFIFIVHISFQLRPAYSKLYSRERNRKRSTFRDKGHRQAILLSLGNSQALLINQSMKNTVHLLLWVGGNKPASDDSILC
jgi:hypothetical protein